MRKIRFTALLLVLTGVASSLHLAACGGDDENQSPNDAGASSSSSSSGGESSPIPDAGASGPTLTISSARGSVYLGQTIVLDGASIAPGLESPVWTLVNAPPESAATSASLADAGGLTPSFKPDWLGSYTLQVSGTIAGRPQSVLVFVDALDAPVFTRESVVDGNLGGQLVHGRLEAHVRGAYGARDRVIACPVEGLMQSSSSQLVLFGALFSASAGDSWEAPPGQPSRVVYVDVDFPALDAGGSYAPSMKLVAATSQSECGAAETRVLDVLEGTSGSESPSLFQAARLSPSGQRVAYQRDEAGRSVLVSVGFDGSARRELSGYHSDGDAGIDAGISSERFNNNKFQLQMRWRDETHVGWISFTSTQQTEWNLYEAADVDAGAVTRIMHCADTPISGFDYLPDGTILASTRHLVEDPDGGQAPMNLTVYRASAAGECEVVRRLTSHERTEQVARDFALSPDKTRVAYFLGLGQGTMVPISPQPSAMRLVTQPVDGSQPPTPVPGAPETGAELGFGPRWIGGGSTLTWGQNNILAIGEGAGPNLGHTVVIPAAGGEMRTVTRGSMAQSGYDPDSGAARVEYHLVYGMGQGCSASPGGASFGVAALGGVIVLGAALGRRRRTGREAY